MDQLWPSFFFSIKARISTPWSMNIRTFFWGGAPFYDPKGKNGSKKGRFYETQCGKKGVDMEIDICKNISDFFRTKVVWNIIRNDLAPFFSKIDFSKFRHVANLAIFGDFWWLLLVISSELSLWYQFFTQNLTLYKFYFWVFAKFRQLAILAIFGGYF